MLILYQVMPTDEINCQKNLKKIKKFLAISHNVRDKRSFRSVAEKIWENCEPSNFPFIPCYVSRRPTGGERSVA